MKSKTTKTSLIAETDFRSITLGIKRDIIQHKLNIARIKNELELNIARIQYEQKEKSFFFCFYATIISFVVFLVAVLIVPDRLDEILPLIALFTFISSFFVLIRASIAYFGKGERRNAQAV